MRSDHRTRQGQLNYKYEPNDIVHTEVGERFDKQKTRGYGQIVIRDTDGILEYIYQARCWWYNDMVGIQ
jgi:hypothetical protein